MSVKEVFKSKETYWILGIMCMKKKLPISCPKKVGWKCRLQMEVQFLISSTWNSTRKLMNLFTHNYKNTKRWRRHRRRRSLMQSTLSSIWREVSSWVLAQIINLSFGFLAVHQTKTLSVCLKKKWQYRICKFLGSIWRNTMKASFKSFTLVGNILSYWASKLWLQ